jgi:hypothetical protein
LNAVLREKAQIPIRKLILASNNEVMVVIIVDHKRMDPDDQVPDGAQITLMMPLEGG